MSALVIVAAIAACRGGEDKRSPAGGGSAGSAGERHSIDVTASDPAYSIRDLELEPTPGKRGAFRVSFRVAAKAREVIAEIKCRVGGYNVIYPAHLDGRLPVATTAIFRPDPFEDAGDPCEVVFYAGTVDTPIAAACVRSGTLVDGVCPAGSFPPPPRQSRNDVELASATLELRDETAVFTALWTLVAPLEAGRHFAGQVHCTDAAGVLDGEAPAAFISLERMPGGSSMYGPLVVPLDRTPAASARCQLRILSRPTTPPFDEMTHGTYCATPAGVLVGPCT